MHDMRIETDPFPVAVIFACLRYAILMYDNHDKSLSRVDDDSPTECSFIGIYYHIQLIFLCRYINVCKDCNDSIDL